MYPLPAPLADAADAAGVCVSVLVLPGRPGLHISHSESSISGVPRSDPRMCRLSDGSILTSSLAYRNNQGILSVSRSTNNAKTFHHHGEVVCPTRDCSDLALLEIPGDPDAPGWEHDHLHVLGAVRNHDNNPANTHTISRITVVESADGGRTWAVLSDAIQVSGPFGVWDPVLHLADHGKQIQLYYTKRLHHHHHEGNEAIMLVRSNTGGRTWEELECVVGRGGGEGEALRCGRFGLAAAPDGGRLAMALILVMETCRSGRYSIETVLSYNDGKTFESPQVVYTAKEGKYAGSPQIVSFPNGTVAVVFMTDEDYDGPPNSRNEAQIKVVYSQQPMGGSLRWGSPQLIAARPCGRPSIMTLPDSKAIVSYDSAGCTWTRLLRVTYDHPNPN